MFESECEVSWCEKKQIAQSLGFARDKVGPEPIVINGVTWVAPINGLT